MSGAHSRSTNQRRNYHPFHGTGSREYSFHAYLCGMEWGFVQEGVLVVLYVSSWTVVWLHSFGWGQPSLVWLLHDPFPREGKMLGDPKHESRRLSSIYAVGNIRSVRSNFLRTAERLTGVEPLKEYECSGTRDLFRLWIKTSRAGVVGGELTMKDERLIPGCS